MILELVVDLCVETLGIFSMLSINHVSLLACFCLRRRFVVWSSWMREDTDRQGDGQSLWLQVHQPAGVHSDRHVVRRVPEADRRRLLVGCKNPAVHHLH